MTTSASLSNTIQPLLGPSASSALNHGCRLGLHTWGTRHGRLARRGEISALLVSPPKPTTERAAIRRAPPWCGWGAWLSVEAVFLARNAGLARWSQTTSHGDLGWIFCSTSCWSIRMTHHVGGGVERAAWMPSDWLLFTD